MTYFIISGHGKYASGMQGALEAIAGEQQLIYYVDYDSDRSSDYLEDKYSNIIKKDPQSDYIFICDIIGATPFKISAMMSIKNSKLFVVGGVNLTAILEAIFHQEMTSVELVNLLIETTKKSVLNFNHKAR